MLSAMTITLDGMLASAGVFHHAGIKIPYFAFFAHDRGHRVAEPPLNMRAAMALAAVVCVGIGVAPSLLYGLLPHAMDYVPFTTPHVVNQLQLLLLASMAFTVLIRTGLYPPEVKSVNLDFDVVYRRFLPSGWHALNDGAMRVRKLGAPLRRHTERVWETGAGALRPGGQTATAWSTHLMVWWVVLLLGLILVITLL
jgi:multicomponent Na+:H+ antiporter subunit D